MSIFFADLHVHSRYSRATSKNLTLRNLAAWAIIKGLDVVATGDFTHPGWLKEIEDSLEEVGNGLLRLKKEKKKNLEKEIPWWGDEPFLDRDLYFILSCEISSIYKKKKRIRKIHNVVFFPSLESVKKFNKYLSKIGNLEADGRPILGFDSEDLLKLVLDIDPYGFLVPAHIWTPWFSLFGANSGFDSIEECFGPYTSEIFALETGLSSDPEMNWLWSELDRFYLISNSDAHSGEKLAREANIFSGEPSYYLIYDSLKKKKKNFLGTIEFFPEEGKYHLDGHRKCKVVLDPKEAIKLNNICPVCKQPITIGVLHRIISLADREKPKKPKDHPDFLSFIPLCEILSEILGGNTRSKGVLNFYKRLIKTFGPELFILKDVPLEELKPVSIWLYEAIKRMRERKVYKKPGFDGQYGQIFLFTEEERKEIKKGKRLLKTEDVQKNFYVRTTSVSISSSESVGSDLSDYNTEQKEAITYTSDPLLVVAGPGTGKTKTLIGRIEYLIEMNEPEEILVVTFSRAAAREIKERIKEKRRDSELPQIDTLHAIGYEVWIRTFKEIPVLLSEEESKRIFMEANPELDKRELIFKWNKILRKRESADVIEDDLLECFENYKKQKEKLKVIDYQDLLEMWLRLLERGESKKYKHVLVDEAQDLSLLQLKIIKNLLPENGKGLFAIGDPNQSIYGFRGSIANIKEEFLKIWPNLKVISLTTNYRSKQNLLDFVAPLFNTKLKAVSEGNGSITFYRSQTYRQEGLWISKRIKELIGGTSLHEMDIGLKGVMSPSDICVLFRFKALIPFYKGILEKDGIPVFVPEDAPFWEDPRINIILQEVERVYGIKSTKDAVLEDDIVKKGPLAIAEKYRDKKPFDKNFWSSPNFLALVEMFQKSNSWEKVLGTIGIEKDFVQISEKAQKVYMLTIHASKGLEFEAVFVPALEDGIIPFKPDLFFKNEFYEKNDIDEEKRLLYVALTRAKSHIFLSCAKKRRIFDKEVSLNPSPFIESLPLELVKKIEIKRKKVKKEKRLKLV